MIGNVLLKMHACFGALAQVHSPKVWLVGNVSMIGAAAIATSIDKTWPGEGSDWAVAVVVWSPIALWIAWMLSAKIHDALGPIIQRLTPAPIKVPERLGAALDCSIHRAARHLRSDEAKHSVKMLEDALIRWNANLDDHSADQRRKVTHAFAVLSTMATKINEMDTKDFGDAPATFQDALAWTTELMESGLSARNRLIAEDVTSDFRVLQRQSAPQ